MLAIRMQRTGRSGHAHFRVIVQDSRFSPKRGRVVSYLGSYDPHTKTATIDSQKASSYLKNGAQPSDRVARLFKAEGIKLPAWVKLAEPKQRTIRHPQKRRSTAPKAPEAAAPSPTDAVADTTADESEEAPAKSAEQSPAEPAKTPPAEPKAADQPVAEAAEDS